MNKKFENVLCFHLINSRSIRQLCRICEQTHKRKVHRKDYHGNPEVGTYRHKQRQTELCRNLPQDQAEVSSTLPEQVRLQSQQKIFRERIFNRLVIATITANED